MNRSIGAEHRSDILMSNSADGADGKIGDYLTFFSTIPVGRRDNPSTSSGAPPPFERHPADSGGSVDVNGPSIDANPIRSNAIKFRTHDQDWVPIASPWKRPVIPPTTTNNYYYYTLTTFPRKSVFKHLWNISSSVTLFKTTENQYLKPRKFSIKNAQKLKLKIT